MYSWNLHEKQLLFTFSWSDAPLGILPAGDIPATNLEVEFPGFDAGGMAFVVDGMVTCGVAAEATTGRGMTCAGTIGAGAATREIHRFQCYECINEKIRHIQKTYGLILKSEDQLAFFRVGLVDLWIGRLVDLYQSCEEKNYKVEYYG